MIKREATALWQGAGKDGKGKLTTRSGVLKDTPYSFSARFENSSGTNPEELIGAAHAGCFAMQLAFMLNEAGVTADELKATASVIMDNPGGKWTITEVRLTLAAKVPGMTDAKFQEIAAKAKAACPVSRLLNAPISLAATLA